MKRAAIIIGMLIATSMVSAQQPAAQGQPAPAGAPQAGGQQPAPAAPAAKHQPAAKTQPEFDAFNAAMANAKDPAAMEKAANDFATKFPDSELRVLLFKQSMRSYQAANDGDKMLEMGRGVLNLDADDPEALVGVAEVLAERTRDTDLDRNQRLAESRKLALRATETVDTDLPLSPTMPPEQVKQAKGYLRSTAYFILGTLDFNAKDYKAAESDLRKSIAEYPQEPIPEAVFRLAVSLDMQDNLDEALKVANQAVQLSKEGTPVGNAARQERDRIIARKGGSASVAPKPANDPNAAPPKQ